LVRQPVNEMKQLHFVFGNALQKNIGEIPFYQSKKAQIGQNEMIELGTLKSAYS